MARTNKAVLDKDIAPSNKELTDQQKLFCAEFASSLNLTKAAEKAGYSKATAAQQGCMLMDRPEIKQRVSQLITEKMNKAEMNVERVLENIKQVFEVATQRRKVKMKKTRQVPILDKDGEPLRYTKGPRKGKKKMKVEEYRGEDYLGWSAKHALKAMEMIGRYLKMFDPSESERNQLYAIVQKYVVYPEKAKDNPQDSEDIMEGEVGGTPALRSTQQDEQQSKDKAPKITIRKRKKAARNEGQDDAVSV